MKLEQIQYTVETETYCGVVMSYYRSLLLEWKIDFYGFISTQVLLLKSPAVAERIEIVPVCLLTTNNSIVTQLLDTFAYSIY